MRKYHGKLSALFYDIENPSPQNDELNFYLSYAKKGMKVLEPMCGSGRFLVEFLKNGFKIDGFDISSAMLKRCEKKILELNKNADLQCCDFPKYETDKQYDYIIIPANSFSMITEDFEILGCLYKLKELCKIDGKIIIELELKNKIHPAGAANIKRVYYKTRKIVLTTDVYKITEPSNIVEYGLTYKIYEGHNNIFMTKELMNVKYYVKGEFENIIKEVGLEIVDKFIDYRKTRYNQEKNGRVIFVIKRPQ